MAVATAIDFKKEVQRLFDLFDRQEFDKIKDMFGDDPQGVDEISRKWLRGRAALNSYFSQVKKMGVTDIHSKLSDVVSKHWDDVALVTVMADQTYKVGGEKVSITAPGSFLFRRKGSDWKLELVHVVPLPESE